MQNITEVEKSTETKEIFEQQEITSGVGLFSFLVAIGDIAPPWWSASRDAFLRNFWKQGDHIAGTVSTLRDMMIAIPIRVVARNNAIKSHVLLAEKFTNIILNKTKSRSNPATTGWGTGYGTFLQDYFTQDNGGFLVIDGEENEALKRVLMAATSITDHLLPKNVVGPLASLPTRLIHLDAFRCTRYMSETWPVSYLTHSGQEIYFHSSRIIALSSMSSGILGMNGVGLSAVSRAIQTAQNMTDVMNYKLEKLGSRPHRAILVGDGIPVRAIKNALELADESMDNQGLKRFAKVPVIGSNKSGVSLDLVDLASLPDGFNDLESTQLGMTILALAFGVDVRQLAFSIGVSGQTRADAEVQHLKMRGKGPGMIIQETERQVNAKFLPPTLKLEFDFQDDAADRAQAEIREKRARARETNIESGVTNVRVERELMLKAGDIDRSQFVQLELADGRLPQGGDLMLAFQTTDEEIRALFNGINPSSPNEVIKEQITLVHRAVVNAHTARKHEVANIALAALERLRTTRKEEAAEEIVTIATKQLTDEEVIAKSPEDAQAAFYRRADQKELQDGRKCTTCFFSNAGNFCTLFSFNYKVGFICDEWRPVNG